MFKVRTHALFSLEAWTIASMPALTASSRSGQVSMTVCRSEVCLELSRGDPDTESAPESEEFGAFSSIERCKSLELLVLVAEKLPADPFPQLPEQSGSLFLAGKTPWFLLLTCPEMPDTITVLTGVLP